MSERSSDDRERERASDPPKLVADDPDLEQARENVFDGWPALTGAADDVVDDSSSEVADEAEGDSASVEADADESAVSEEPAEPHAVEPFGADAEPEEAVVVEVPGEPTPEHAPGELAVPPGYNVLEGAPSGSRRAVGVVVARFNGDVTTRLLESALEELDRAGVDREAITVMPVPGAFELPLAAMALAKTRRFAAIVALGCVIRGETPHFDYVASEAASGLQLAALETGVPVAFGVLTLDTASQVDERVGKGADAVRTALEMADLFANLRAAASV
jgi:6,7-dimethyl-8-ribityllumazine synthase